MTIERPLSHFHAELRILATIPFIYIYIYILYIYVVSTIPSIYVSIVIHVCTWCPRSHFYMYCYTYMWCYIYVDIYRYFDIVVNLNFLLE